MHTGISGNIVNDVKGKKCGEEADEYRMIGKSQMCFQNFTSIYCILFLQYVDGFIMLDIYLYNHHYNYDHIQSKLTRVEKRKGIGMHSLFISTN